MKLLQRFVFVSLLFAWQFAGAQLTTNPEFPVADKKVTITFDSKNDSRLGYCTEDLYAHTGVGIEDGSNWQHVIGNWNENTRQPKLTHIGNGVYKLDITPDINTFYGVASNEKVINISFVLRTATGSKQTNDMFVTVYKSGLNVDLQFPTANAILKTDSSYTFSAVASSTASIKLYLNNEMISETSGVTISKSMQFTEPGDHKMLVVAQNTEGIEVRDSAFFCVTAGAVSETRPGGLKKGITYPTNQSAQLCLFAPGKESVFLLGDFNNWQPQNSFQMKKDGNYFWIELTGLENGKEYAFQYLIDGKIKIADPYAEKISDPWNDSSIPNSTYPNLMSYPEGKADGIVSVLQPGQTNFEWAVTDFEIPSKEKLVIYELLVRDFTTDRTYTAVREKLDYLKDLQINVLELMPVNEFEGNNSWGYNPSFYFAPDKYYGSKNELKKLIDECHKRGIAVVIDMVLNHSYGQSPLVKMYWDELNSRPSANNPWYNTVSPNTTYSWGYDFNHESSYTKEFIDSVNSFWMSEYNVDGFRFDFTKGFTNTSGDGSAYDASRIAILERMADEIWKRKPGALVICEHLADNSEEKVLANHGLLLWGNLNYNYGEAAMGYTESNKSDLSWGIYSKRGWDTPNLVTYQESHDEERMAYKCQSWGNSLGSYNIKNTETTIDRMKLNAVFHLPLPGPKMIWQFGELGYNYSINTCEDGTISDDCRLSMKPVKWDYIDDEKRSELFRVYADLNYLKQNYEEFTPTNFSASLTGAQKSYTLSNGNNYVIVLGNFALIEASINVSIPKAGTWYNYFERTSMQVSSRSIDVLLQPGEYLILSTREFAHPKITTVDVDETISTSFTIYPNPVQSLLKINCENLRKVEVYDLSGRLVYSTSFETNDVQKEIDLSSVKPGIYFIKSTDSKHAITTGKIIKQ